MTFVLIFITAVLSATALKNNKLFERMALIPYRVVHRKEWYRVISYGFVHGDYMHLIVNMLVLLSFGPYLEQLFKTYEYAGTLSNEYLSFALLYFGGLIVSVIPDLIRKRNNPQYSSIGASGAVSAVIFASVFFNPLGKIYLMGIIPLPGILFALLYIGYEQYMNRRQSDRINHEAHLCGAIFGFIYPLLIDLSLWRVFTENLTK
ncbi:MAG TPA: rhomboid family intramembrane serine protease [Candidatus Alistipes pullicola]|nr:rhomboid family intramembrane serine protease [Candidatus Alistipes pullicola]